MARADPVGFADLAQLPLSRLGSGQQPVERVPRLPALRAPEAVRTRRHTADRARVRGRRLPGLGTPSRGVGRPGLARSPQAVRRKADPGRRRTCGRRGVDDRGADGHRLDDGDVEVAAPQPPRGAADAAPRWRHAGTHDPHQRRRHRHARSPSRVLPGTPGGPVAETDAAPGSQPSARHHLPGRRPPRRLPQERPRPGRTARAAPRRRARQPVPDPEDDERPHRAEGRRPAGPQRAHQPRRHRRPPDGPAARPAAGQGERPRPAMPPCAAQTHPADPRRSRFPAARGDQRRRL